MVVPVLGAPATATSSFRSLAVRRRALPVVAALLLTGLALTVPSTDATLTVVDPDADPSLCRMDVGTAGEVSDDAFVLGFNGSSVTRAGDLRLMPSSGKSAGTIVQPGDLEDGLAAECTIYTVAYYDVNNNARYDLGDSALMGNNANASQLIQPATDSEWWIRLTPSSGNAAGTLVRAGDADVVSFGAGALLAGAEFAYADLDSNARFDEGENAYATSEAVSTGDAVPLYSIRLHPTGQFGSQVQAGDSDISVILTDPEPDMRLARIDFGTAGVVTDDCFYLHTGTNNSSISTHDVRLAIGAGCTGKAPGTLVSDADVTEKSQTAVIRPYTAAYYDMNNNAQFDLGDTMLLGNNANGANLVQSSNNTEWWIRVTPSMGKAAGTLVVAGDADLVTFGSGHVVTGAETAFADNDNSAQFSPGDWLYVTSQAIETGNSVPIASVRIVRAPGEFGTQEGAPTGTTSPSPSPTTTTTTTTTTSPPPRPPPAISLDRPHEGETVRHVVDVGGTVSFAGNHTVRVYVNVFGDGTGYAFLADNVASSGAWSVAWDTRTFQDGRVRIEAYACYTDGFGPCSFSESVNVYVRNVEVQVDHGIVGCAAHAGPVVLEDFCDGITEFSHTVHPHLARATFALNWTGLTPLSIHDLRLTVQIGNRTFTAEGSSTLTLEASDVDVTTDGLATMTVSVGKAGVGPDVALDEEFVLSSTWSYK